MDRMSPTDASFLHIEDGVNHMHIASVAVFEGPPPPYEELVAMVAGKLPLVPRYRQRVRSCQWCQCDRRRRSWGGPRCGCTRRTKVSNYLHSSRAGPVAQGPPTDQRACCGLASIGWASTA